MSVLVGDEILGVMRGSFFQLFFFFSLGSGVSASAFYNQSATFQRQAPVK